MSMSTSTSINTSGYRARLRQRLMLAFTGYTVLVSALFGLFAMAFVYTVEDQFFDSALRQEAQAQDSSLRAGKGWREPAQDFIRLYRPGQALPEDLAQARLREPRARELSGEQGRHYHLWPLPENRGLLVAEVSGQLIVRPMRRQLLLWLGAWGGGLALLALGLGWWLARRTSAPWPGWRRRSRRADRSICPPIWQRVMATMRWACWQPTSPA